MTKVFAMVLAVAMMACMFAGCGSSAPASTAAPAASAAPASADTPSQEVVAAVSAALAEELGTDITRIRILSIQKL